MSIKISIEKICRELSYKKLIILDGNVLDIYFDKGIFLNLNDYLMRKVKDMNLFDDIYVWDRIEGLLHGDTTKLKTIETKEVGKPLEIEGLDNNLFDDSSESGKYKSTCEFFPLLYKNLLDSSRRKLFIVNYSNYLFSQTQSLSDSERETLTMILRGVREQQIRFESKNNGSVVIFIVNNISDFPVSIYHNNPDARIINLSKPDRDERQEIINEMASHFVLKTDLSVDNDSKIELVDSLENFTNKEVMQTAQLSKSINEFLSVEKLLSLYKYGKKESPWEKLETRKIKNIIDILSKRVKGQDEPIKKVKDVVIRAKTGLSGLQHSKAKSKPKGVLFFAGPTGVGKTELAKSLAEFIFGDESSCIRFDMSEYNHEHSDQKLIGAPPGYIGYEAGGQLTNLIKERPFSVLLLDEIEKAHPKILDKFLQILEDGRLTDNKGETVYFSECIIIFTSNIGANQVNPSMSKTEINKTIFSEIKQKFENEINRPELLGRIGYGNIIVFNFINDINIARKIAETKIIPIINYLKESKKMNLVFKNKDEFLDYIISLADITKGGRDIINKLEDVLVTSLANYIFENDGYIAAGSTLSVTLSEKKELIFDY